MSKVPAETDKVHSCYYRIVLVSDAKIAFLQKSVDPIPRENWDDPEKRIRGIVLPTKIPEVGHCVQYDGVSFGTNDTAVHFSIVDAWRDLGLSIDEAVAKLKERKWEKCHPDYRQSQLRQIYFIKLFPHPRD